MHILIRKPWLSAHILIFKAENVIRSPKALYSKSTKGKSLLRENTNEISYADTLF